MSRKLFVFALALACAALIACNGNNNGSTPASNASTPAPAAAAPIAPASNPDIQSTALGLSAYPNDNDAGPFTSATRKVVSFGSWSAPFEGPYFLTSVGQSSDVSMMDALLKRSVEGIEYTYSTLAKAADISGAKTVIICSGASSKGLGAAGISSDDEKARAAEILAMCREKDIKVIFAHLGGTARRGPLSDEFSEQVMEYASFMLVVEAGNDDGKFTSYAKAHNIPIVLALNIAECVAPLKDILK